MVAWPVGVLGFGVWEVVGGVSTVRPTERRAMLRGSLEGGCRVIESRSLRPGQNEVPGTRCSCQEATRRDRIGCGWTATGAPTPHRGTLLAGRRCPADQR